MKKHEILSQIESDLEGLPRTTVVSIGRSKFKLKLLPRSLETKARSLVNADNLLTAFADSNVPQLAFAITHINDTKVEELFTATTEEENKELSSLGEDKWRAKQLAEWLSNRETVLVERLWLAYLSLKDDVGSALEQLEDFSTTTPSGA